MGDYNHWPIGGKLERFSIGGAQNSTISVEVSLGGLKLRGLVERLIGRGNSGFITFSLIF